MHIAVDSGKTDIVQFLIEKGANMDLQTEVKSYYIQNKLSFLFDRYIVWNKTTKQTGATPLIFASFKHNTTIVRSLVEKGAKIDIQDTVTTSLPCVKIYLQLLMDDMNHLQQSGLTAMIFASENGYMDIMQYLVDNGGNMDLQNKVVIIQSLVKISDTANGRELNFPGWMGCIDGRLSKRIY